MASKNGIKKMVTTPMNESASSDAGFNTKGLIAGYAHPTPRAAISQWRCTDHDPEVFHPTDPETLAEAQGVCGPCPMRTQCLALGLDRKEWGVWGGVLLEGGKPLAAPRGPGRPSNKSLAAAAQVGRSAEAA